MTLLADRRHADVDVAGIARFRVVDGEHVMVDRDPGTTDTQIGVWLFGTVAALLLGQQGRFALHASTVDLPGSAVAVSGAIGSGKSTTSLALAGRGHRLVADDVSPLTVVGGAALLEPFGRPVHVWPATYAALGTVPPPEARPMAESDKLGLPAPSDGGPVGVGAVVVIHPSGAADEVTLTPITRTRAVRLLVNQAYRTRLVQRLWPVELLHWCAELSSVVATFEIARPVAAWTATEVAEAVELVAARSSASGRA